MEKPTAYMMDVGHPVYIQGGIRHQPDPGKDPTSFFRAMDMIDTPESHAMKAAHNSGVRWAVGHQDMGQFANYRDHLHDLLALGMSDPGDEVSFHVNSFTGDQGLQTNNGEGKYTHVGIKPAAGWLTLHSIQAPGNQGTGWGGKKFLEQVLAARRLGIHTIHVPLAVGRKGTANSGYYVWPRLGFDGPIPEHHQMTPRLKHIKTFHELFDHPDGPHEWREGGLNAFNLMFHTDPDSPHVKRLVTYLQSRKGGGR